MITLYTSSESFTSNHKESHLKLLCCSPKKQNDTHISTPFNIQLQAPTHGPPVEDLAFPNRDVVPHDPTAPICLHPEPETNNERSRTT